MVPRPDLHVSGMSCYCRPMDFLYALRLILVTISIGGIIYACVGTGVFSREQTNWWDELPKPKKIAAGAAIAATILQTFL